MANARAHKCTWPQPTPAPCMCWWNIDWLLVSVAAGAGANAVCISFDGMFAPMHYAWAWMEPIDNSTGREAPGKGITAWRLSVLHSKCVHICVFLSTWVSECVSEWDSVVRWLALIWPSYLDNTRYNVCMYMYGQNQPLESVSTFLQV